jgi:hypothetical protein
MLSDNSVCAITRTALVFATHTGILPDAYFRKWLVFPYLNFRLLGCLSFEKTYQDEGSRVDASKGQLRATMGVLLFFGGEAA